MCGVFQGLVVCVTGFAVDKRKEIQDLTKHNGTEHVMCIVAYVCM